MPDQARPGDRTAAERAADHAGIARLADVLVPALVAKLGTAGLGEVEIHEGDWQVRVRRSGAGGTRRERSHRAPLPIVAPSGASSPPSVAVEPDPDDPVQEAAIAPAVGMFKPALPVGTPVRAGDRIATVDLLGIALDVVAPIDGILVEVYPQAGDGVEYGEEVALIEAEPASPAAAAEA